MVVAEILVQRAAAALDRSKRHGRVELLKLRLKSLVDQQQGFQGAVEVAVATRDDFVDGGFARS